MSAQFTILTVCTGNICRSPLAERLLAQQLSDIPEITVSSAGTHGLVGWPMQAESQKIAANLGMTDTATHRARQTTEKMLASADLILALARDHRRSIVEISPRCVRRTFTLREFARVSAVVPDDDLVTSPSSTPVERLRYAVKAAGVNRGLSRTPENPADDDVLDPYRRGDAAYVESTAQITPAIDATVAYLRRALAAV